MPIYGVMNQNSEIVKLAKSSDLKLTESLGLNIKIDLLDDVYNKGLLKLELVFPAFDQARRSYDLVDPDKPKVS